MKKIIILIMFLFLAGCAGKQSPDLYPNEHIKSAGEPKAQSDIVVHSLTTPKPIVAPIAYGYIDNKGKIVAGSGNFTCERDSKWGAWHISIANINYLEGEYLMFVTPSAFACSIVMQ